MRFLIGVVVGIAGILTLQTVNYYFMMPQEGEN